jgi:hypothetical protein
MPVDYAEVLKEIEVEEERLLTELNTIRAAKPAIMRLLASKKSNPVEPLKLPLRGQFVGMGATKAIPLHLKNIEFAVTSRQIMDGLKAEGWTSESKDHLATVSATLSQLKDMGIVRRLGDGWMLARTTISAPNGSWEMSIAQQQPPEQ